MPQSTVTAKGQTTIPRSIRKHLNLHPGDKLEFVVTEGSEVLLRPATVDVTELRGLLHDAVKRPVAIEDMNAAVRRRGGGR